ncbi:MAG: tetratricopeptide repeat protein [Planctomycetes bacterium]|nr:tetratricopeptide repeat protein [Planctomycetota bacterium]
MPTRSVTHTLLLTALAVLMLFPGVNAAENSATISKPILTIIQEPPTIKTATELAPEAEAVPSETEGMVAKEAIPESNVETVQVMPATAAQPLEVEEYTRCPEEDIPQKKPAPATPPKITTVSEINPSARIAYVMAGNRVRQGEYKDALRYYMEALSTEPRFVQAMADIALIYKYLGDFDSAQDITERAIMLSPDDSNLYHIKGEIHQARGLELKEHRQEYESGVEIHTAVISYGKAIELAEQGGAMALRAGTYFRLGEICYFGHGDPDGARLYWQQVLDLHSPIPDLSEPVKDYRQHTKMSVELLTWQGWAKSYLRTLDSVIYGPRPRPAPGGELYGNAGEGEEISFLAPSAQAQPKRRFWNWRPRR